MNNTTNNTTKCTACQVEVRLFSEDAEVRATVTQQERNHWSLWGCTCSPEAEAEAVAWMDTVTR